MTNRLTEFKELFHRFVEPGQTDAELDEVEYRLDGIWPQLTAEEQARAERWMDQLAEEQTR